MARTVRGKVIIEINNNEVKQSLSSIGKEIGRLKKEMRELDKADADYEDNLKRLQIQLREARRNYRELNQEINQTRGATSQLGSVFKLIGPLVGVAFSAKTLMEFYRWTKENLEQVRKLKRELAELSGQDGAQLNRNVSATRALAQTYDLNESEVLQTINAISAQMGISFEQAFDKIKDSMQGSEMMSADLLKNLKQYAPIMREAQIPLEDFAGIMSFADSKGMSLEKTMQAVGKFSIRVRKNAAGTREAIQNLGIDVENFYKKLETGEMSYFDAMKQVSAKLDEVGSSSTKAGDAIKKIFGKDGAAAGYEFLASLHKIGDQTSKLSAVTADYTRQKQLEYDANKRMNDIWAQLAGTGGELNMMYSNMKLLLGDIVMSLFGIQELRPSDDVKEQQISLNSLKRELINVNTTQERRKELIQEIQSIYPNIFKNLDTETASNLELANAIDLVSASLRKRYQALALNEDIEKRTAKLAGYQAELGKQDVILQNQIEKLKEKYKIEIPVSIQTQGLEAEAKWLKDNLKTNFLSFDKWGLSATLGGIESYTQNIQHATDAIDEMKKSLDQLDPGFANKKMITDHLDMMQQAILNGSGTKTTTTGLTTDQLKEQQKKADEARKAAERAAEQERRRREQVNKDLLTEEKKFYDALLKQQRDAEDSRLAIMDEGFEKDRAKLQAEHDRKIQDIRIQIEELIKLQSELEAKAATESSKGNPQAAKKYRELAKEQIQIIAEKNVTIDNLERLHFIKSQQLFFDYQKKQWEKEQQAADRKLMNLETEQNNELKQIKTLEEAKQILRDKYGLSEDELKKIRSFEKAKSVIVLEQNKQTYAEQSVLLQEQIDKLNKMLAVDDDLSNTTFGGLFSEEEREQVLEFIDQLKNKLSSINEDTPDGIDAENQKLMSFIDIFGFSADQWQEAFDNLDTMSGKLQLAQMAVQAMSNAWSMFYSVQQQNMRRDLDSYTAATNRKKDALKKQLDEGYISEATYNAKIEKLDADLEKKRAEMEYRSAVAEWKMSLMQAATNTAVGITSALSMKPPNFVIAGIVGGIGAIQAGLIAGNRPKKPEGYFDGGPVGGSGRYDERGRELADGPLHKDEYVIPAYLRRQPDIARMEEFIEARRLGYSSPGSDPVRPDNPDGSLPGSAYSNYQSSDPELTAAVIELTGVIRDLKDNPIEAKLTRTLEVAKHLSDDLEEYKIHKNKNRR